MYDIKNHDYLTDDDLILLPHITELDLSNNNNITNKRCYQYFQKN